jgi:hypothetical protein
MLFYLKVKSVYARWDICDNLQVLHMLQILKISTQNFEIPQNDAIDFIANIFQRGGCKLMPIQAVSNK